MILFIFLFFGLYLGGNFYIFFRGWQAFTHLPLPLTITGSVLFWVCTFLLPAFFLIRNVQIPMGLAQVIQYIGTGWLVFTLYMVILLLGIDFLKLFHVQIPYGFRYVFLITVSVLAYGYYNYTHPKTRVINIDINKPSTSYQQLKIIGISDIHLGYATNKRILKKYVELVNSQHPDLILIGGDLIDNSVHPVKLQRMEEELNSLSAPLGVYMVPGNHEYISQIKASIDYINSTKIHLLLDSVITLPGDILLVGRDDRANSHRKTLEELTHDIDKSKPVILLDHQPFEIKEAEKAGVDFQFSGHTHRGQVFPINLLTDKLFEISYGYRKKGNTHFYVSTGLSLWGPPFRIGTDSELVVFNIRFTGE